MAILSMNSGEADLFSGCCTADAEEEDFIVLQLDTITSMTTKKDEYRIWSWFL
jgi:hypothetical protein